MRSTRDCGCRDQLASQAHSSSTGFAAAALIALGMGGEGDITPYLLSRYFSLNRFPGPVIMGRACNYTGSFDRLLMKLSGLTLGTALLSLTLPRYGKPSGAETVPDLELQAIDRRLFECKSSEERVVYKRLNSTAR